MVQGGQCSCRGSGAGAGAGCVPLALVCPARSLLSRSQHRESCGEEVFCLVIFLAGPQLWKGQSRLLRPSLGPCPWPVPGPGEGSGSSRGRGRGGRGEGDTEPSRA